MRIGVVHEIEGHGGIPGLHALLVDHESGLRARVSILITEGHEGYAKRLGNLIHDRLDGLKWDPETEEVL